MPRDLVSPTVRVKFREYFVSTSLSRIDDAFSAEGFKPDLSFDPPVGGQRRTLVEQYYHSIDWHNPQDAAKVLRVYEAVLVELEIDAVEGRVDADWARKQSEALRRWLRRDGISETDGRLTLSGHASLHEALSSLNAPELQRQIDRMRASVEEDPGLAIGTAKELVETVCKIILVDRGVAPDASWDAQRLVKETRQVLTLLPDDVDESARGIDSIRRLLSNLGTLVTGLAELRNLYGTGHGKHGHARGVHPRHARLAVGAAATLATFLLETHEARER